MTRVYGPNKQTLSQTEWFFYIQMTPPGKPQETCCTDGLHVCVSDCVWLCLCIGCNQVFAPRPSRSGSNRDELTCGVGDKADARAPLWHHPGRLKINLSSPVNGPPRGSPSPGV